MIDMNGDQLFADGPDQQSGHNGTVHTSGESQQDFSVTDLGADCFYLFIDESLRQFGCGDSLHTFGTLIGIHVHPPIHCRNT